MAKAVSIVLPILFFVMFASVENTVRADTCSEGLGGCKLGGSDCDMKCKAKHGSSGQGSCDNIIGPALCTCYFQCGPTPTPPTKRCDGGAGLCSAACGPDCCNQKCAMKYRSGVGFCNSLGNVVFCQCNYPC